MDNAVIAMSDGEAIFQRVFKIRVDVAGRFIVPTNSPYDSQFGHKAAKPGRRVAAVRHSEADWLARLSRSLPLKSLVEIQLAVFRL